MQPHLFRVLFAKFYTMRKIAERVHEVIGEALIRISVMTKSYLFIYLFFLLRNKVLNLMEELLSRFETLRVHKNSCNYFIRC